MPTDAQGNRYGRLVKMVKGRDVHDLPAWAERQRQELLAAAAERDAAAREPAPVIVQIAPGLDYASDAQELDRRVRRRMLDDGVPYVIAQHRELNEDPWLKHRIAGISR